MNSQARRFQTRCRRRITMSRKRAILGHLMGVYSLQVSRGGIVGCVNIDQVGLRRGGREGRAGGDC